jgi:hypothetical protein
VGVQMFTVLAEELDGAARVELWPKLVAEVPSVGEFQAKTTRQMGIHTDPPGLTCEKSRRSAMLGVRADHPFGVA